MAIALTAPMACSPTSATCPPVSDMSSDATDSNSTPDVSAAARVVQAQLDAYNARDIDAFMATFHPEAELFSVDDPTPRASGHQAVRAIYADLFARSPELHSELVHRATLGRRVIDHERITGREGGEVLEIVMVYEVEDAKIRRAWAVK